MKKVIAIFLAFCISLTFSACSNIADGARGDATPRRQTQNFSNSTATTSSVSTYTFPSDFSDSMLKLLNCEVSFTSSDFSALESALAQINVTYPHEELYGVSEAYQRYLKLPKYSSTHENYFSDGIFTDKELFDIVKKNNTEEKFQPNKKITDSDLKYICKIIAPMLLEYGKNMTSSDAALLSEKIGALKIFTFTGFSAGSYDSSSNQLGLDVTQKNTDKFSRTVQHETHHMIQASSLSENAARGYNSRYGVSYIFDEGKDQPFDFRWISEGSAELLTHNRLNSRNYDVYEDVIKVINYIKVATILRPDVDSTSFERLTLSSDIEGLFNYFGCKSQEEKQEFINMLAAINYMYDLQSCSSSFKERYQKKYGESFSSNDFRIEVINSLGVALSREFFRNLSTALKGKTLSVEEIFTLNTLFEHRVCDYSLYRGPEKCEDMLSSYKKLQSQFFATLAKKLNVSVEVLYNTYDVYYVKAEITADSIPLLSKDEAKFLQYTTESTYNERFRSVNQYLIRMGK